jgi:cysteine-rich repeat protein
LCALVALTTTGRAFGQVDCSVPGGCVTLKFGLGINPDFRADEVPRDNFRYTAEFFGPDSGGTSYFPARTEIGTTTGTCGPERGFNPLQGQVLLREQANCTPTSFGPSCDQGPSIGAVCHLPTVNQTCTGAGAPQACCLGPGRGTCTGFVNTATNIHECGIGGRCALGAGVGCRVEIPLSDGGVTPPAQTSEVRIFTLSPGVLAANGDTAFVSSATGHTLGGTSFDGVHPIDNVQCLVSSATTQGNVRRKPSSGWRYLLPANRGGGNGKTYIRWDSSAGLDATVFSDLSTSFRANTDDSAVCCSANTPTLNTCSVILPPASPNYPLLLARTCAQAGRYPNEDNIVNDWVFEGGRNSRFITDPDFVLPGQIPGICENNRSVACYRPNLNQDCIAAGQAFDRPLACCTGPGTGTCTANSFCQAPGPSGPPSRNPFSCCVNAGTGTCGDPCATLDADPDTPGLQPDRCDLTTDGFRIQLLGGRVPFVAGATNYALINDSRRDFCGQSIEVLRGVPNAGCSLTPRFDYAGDPGPDCGVLNYGIDARDDANCDGAADFPDLCPRNSEWDQNLDSDGDCGTPGSPGYPSNECRGDECECGDQDGDGIFSGTYEIGNGKINVADLVSINLAIFGSAPQLRLCDANNDTACNVSDIVGANREIFTPDSSLCRQITPRQCLPSVPAPCCGNGQLETSEFCDDGDLAPDDGCNGACRVEFGWTCNAASPSVCTRNP